MECKYLRKGAFSIEDDLREFEIGSEPKIRFFCARKPDNEPIELKLGDVSSFCNFDDGASRCDIGKT